MPQLYPVNKGKVINMYGHATMHVCCSVSACLYCVCMFMCIVCLLLWVNVCECVHHTHIGTAYICISHVVVCYTCQFVCIMCLLFPCIVCVTCLDRASNSAFAENTSFSWILRTPTSQGLTGPTSEQTHKSTMSSNTSHTVS